MQHIDKMIQEIKQEVDLTRHYLDRDVLTPQVLDAMRQVQRHQFTPNLTEEHAYENHAAYIGCGQTISQPYMVALMTDLLVPTKEDVVLEVGTGSGYQAAVLSTLVKHLYSIEIIRPLAEQAKRRLRELGYRNVSVKIANGYYGWLEHAPYDGIIVTAAATHIPSSLIEQLKPEGRLVIPIGLPHLSQELCLVQKDAKDNIHTKGILSVAFVPLTEEQSR